LEKSEGTFSTFGPNPPADTVSIEFRAIGPIEEQLAFARWALRRVQRQLGFDPRSAPRFNRRKFPQHLQILDALDAGATYEEIKSRLFGNRSGAKDRLRKQAAAIPLCIVGLLYALPGTSSPSASKRKAGCIRTTMSSVRATNVPTA
jgi:hypothetical protein